MNRVLLLYSDMPADVIETLKREAQVVGPLAARDNWHPMLAEADAIITGVDIHFTAEVLDQATKLRVIGRPGIGVDNIDIPAAIQRGICVVNTPDAPTEPVAEKVVGWILMLSHRLHLADRVARSAGWKERDLLKGYNILGKTLGLVGVGRVGGRVAQMCSGALGMRMIAYDPYLPSDRARQLGVELITSVEAMLPQCDFLSLHCPLTEETHGMIGEQQLRMMKPTAFLINTARGLVIDETAFVTALRKGWIAGAALDVWTVEPPPADHPLLEMDNVILAPHVGSFTAEGVQRMSIESAEQVLQVLRGERPPNLVNPTVWDRRR